MWLSCGLWVLLTAILQHNYSLWNPNKMRTGSHLESKDQAVLREAQRELLPRTTLLKMFSPLLVDSCVPC